MLTSFLESIGLSSAEARIYLAALSEPMTTEEIIVATGIKQSTVYYALRSLQQKQLAHIEHVDGKRMICIAPPNEISRYDSRQADTIAQQQIALEHLLPHFPAVTSHSDTSVAQFSTIDGIKTIIDTALDCVTPEWRIIAPRENFLSEYDRTFARYFMAKRNARRIKAKTLWEAPRHHSASASLNQLELLHRNPRYLDAKYMDQFNATIILFDDSIAYISSLSTLEGILITSREMSAMMRVMFDALWEHSQVPM
jgi:sugar-specific transcriptional regulator TrmB